jgi:hypothetical protein
VVYQSGRDAAELSERQSWWNASGLEAYLVGLLLGPLYLLRRKFSLSEIRMKRL